MLEIVPLILGPVATNTYLIADTETGEAAVIDPAWDGQLIAAEAKQRNWRIGQLWITHAHFDHIGGTGDLVRSLPAEPVIALHPNDRFLWNTQGEAAHFGLSLPTAPDPTLNLVHGMDLYLGRAEINVLHTPGHTPGHCIYYCADAGVCFCGDLIFRKSVGRTDLPGGNWESLVTSIRSQVFALPDETRLLPGHGLETNVGQEKIENPFVHG